MITGYTAGTRVKWNDGNSLETGVVMCVLRKDAHIDIDGETVHVDVSADSPAYLVIHDNGKRVLLSHRDVMLKHVNVYT